MAAGGRRARMRGRGQTLLPVHARRRLSHTLSCWYCDIKFSAFNELLFSLGHRNARFFRVWFAIGVGFSIMVLIGFTMILLWETAWSGHLYGGRLGLSDLSLSRVFGISSWVPGLGISFMDAGIMVHSTLISVVVHEFGHAVAAASQGIQIEYISIFLVIIFPGALVAFNYDLLQTLPCFTALRIYCAGIWHNAMFCAVCWLALSLLPSILYPLYIHGERPMVLSVPPASPLSRYLSHGDIIMSLDGADIHNPQDWMKKLAQLDAQTLKTSYHPEDLKDSQTFSGRKGYCVPSSWLEESKRVQSTHDETFCPDETAAFMSMPCFTLSLLDEGHSEGGSKNITWNMHCLAAKDVVKLKRCGNGWQTAGADRNSLCLCSKDECCSTPVQTPGMTWVEVSFSRPSSECIKLRRNSSATNFGSPGSGSSTCGETFVFVGDVISMAISIKVSAYQPRFALGSFVSHIPNILEKVLVCTFHVSASLALLNSMPVFFLDGESIVETGLSYVTWLSPRSRRKVLKLLLSGGTLLLILTLWRTFFFIFVRPS